jgi:hypothetical protein
MAGLTRYETAGSLVNRAQRSLNLRSVDIADPYSDPDPSIQLLCTLVTECGQELVQNNAWQKLVASYEFTTAPGDTGDYPLPDDFGYMIDQTQWQQGPPGAAYPLLGPASAQWWSYLEASQLYTITIYAWFRVQQGLLTLWPQPPAVGIPIRFEYISRGWAIEGTSPPDQPAYTDNVTQSIDIVLFEPILFLKRLKLAWLTAKGFDTSKAQDEFVVALDSWIGKDTSAPKLSLNGPLNLGTKFLDQSNVPQTGFGS